MTAFITNSQIGEAVRHAFYTGNNLALSGVPACGKTYNLELAVEGIREECAANGTRFVYSYLNGGTLSPSDLVLAMPDDERPGRLRYYYNGNLPNAYDDPDISGILFIPEITLAGAAATAALQKVENHEDMGGYKLPDGIVVISDGNLHSDKSGVQGQSRAHQSRYAQLEVTLDYDWMLEVYKRRYHSATSAFLTRNRTLIDNYSEVYNSGAARGADDDMTVEGRKGVWCSMRSWWRVSKSLSWLQKAHPGRPLAEVVNPHLHLYSSIGSGAGALFYQHLTMLDSLVSIEDIYAHPKTAVIPDDPVGQFFLASTLAKVVTAKQFPAAAVYLQRMDREQQLVFLVSFRERNPRMGGGTKRMRDPEMVKIETSDEWINWAGDKAFSNRIIDATRQIV